MSPLDELIAELIDSLEGWAFEREKVLAKLDIHSARHARQLATELYLARQIATSGDPDMIERAEIRVAMLRSKAVKLLSGESRAEAPEETDVDLSEFGAEPPSQRPTLPFPEKDDPPPPRQSGTHVRSIEAPGRAGAFTNRALSARSTPKIRRG